MGTFKFIEHDDGLTGPGGELLTLTIRGRDMAGAFGIAARLGVTVHVYELGTYLLSYCGGSPYWFDAEDSMHQIGSHGWCHDCHKAGKGYVHHLAEPVELAELTELATSDDRLRKQCRADGMTAGQWAASVARRAVPAYGDHSFSTDYRELGTDLVAGTATFAVDMWDMTTRRVTVELAPGATEMAMRLAEEQAFAEEKHLASCSDCQGTLGRHARDCRSVELDRLWAEHVARQPS